MLYRGAWITAAEELELERREADAQSAKLARDRAQLELEAKRLELAQKKREASSPAADTTSTASSVWGGYSLGYGPVVVPGACAYGRWAPHVTPPQSGPAPFPIVGAHDPRNMSGDIPGVVNPRTRH